MAEWSFPAVLAANATADPDGIAVQCGDRSISRQGLESAANRAARCFAGMGVEQGDLVTIGLPNSIDWFVACLAAWKLGAVPNPVSPLLPAAERDAIIDRAEPALVVGFSPEEISGRAAIAAGHEVDGSQSDESLPDRTSPVERALTSGGSTGLPKLILARSPATYDPDTAFVMFSARRWGLIAGPLYHGIPFASAWRSLLAGASVVVMARFDASECLELIDRHGVDRVTFVPTMMQRIARLSDEERASRDMSSLEFVLTSGSPCPQWLMKFWIDWLGPDVMHESFGSTERIGGTFITGAEWLEHPGSVGKPTGGSRIRILDPETGAEREPGELGEIYMMPPGGPGTSYRYVGADPRITADGWESVGDMGYVDVDGYLYIGDRRGDMILCRGRNIFPAEIEGALGEHPKVRSCAVIGLPDEDLGQSVHAIVEAAAVTATDLTTHLRERLVYYKVPNTFEFVDQPLRDDAGKLRRSLLRESRLALHDIEQRHPDKKA